MVDFVKGSYSNQLREIPTAALLTGVNMPDHVVQFTTLIRKIKQDVSPHVACLYSENCHSIKSFIENMISEFINNFVPLDKEEVNIFI